MSRTYILSLADVKCLAGINPNVPDDKLKKPMDLAHLECEERIGTARYAALIAAIAADSTLAGDANAKWRNMIADGYLKEYLANLTYHKAMPALHSAADTSGFFAKGGANYESVDSRTLGMHSSEAKDAYQLYERKLLKWIADNEETADLPDRESPTTSDEDPAVAGIAMVRSPYYNLQNEEPC